MLKKNHDRVALIGWIVSILVPVIVSLLPVSGIFTGSLKTFFVITLFVILIIAFELLPKLIAAILLPSLYLISGLVPADIGFASWTSTTVWMVMGGLILSNVLEDCGLLKRIAFFVIRKCGGTYTGVVFGCFIIGIILNLITFCNGWLVASVLVYGICRAMDLKPSKESALVCFAGTIGATGCTVCLFYPGYFSIMEESIREFIPDFTMTMTSSFQYNGWFVLWSVLLILIMMKVYRIKDLKINVHKEYFEEQYAALGKVSTKEKKAILMIVLLLAYLMTCRLFGLPEAYGFMVIPFLMFIPGIRLGDENTLKRLNYSTVFFVSACLGIGTVGAAVGFGDFLTAIVVPVLEGKGTLVVCLIFLTMGMIANLFMTPYAMLGGLSLPFAQIAVSLGMSPVAACMLLLYSCELLFFPYESAGNLIMYEFGMLPMKEFIKQMTLKTIIMYLGFIFVMYPMWHLLGFI